MAHESWREVVKSPEATKVFVALDDPKYTWRTAKAIARQTGLEEDQVWDVVKSHPRLLRLSRTSSVSGEPLVGLHDRVGE